MKKLNIPAALGLGEKGMKVFPLGQQEGPDDAERLQGGHQQR